MGDINLNQNFWNKPQNEKTPYEKAQTPMVEQLQSRILAKGTVVINNRPTWNIDNPTSPGSCLDLILVNRKDKVQSHRTIFPTFSDHALLELVYKHKETKIKCQYIKSRNLKKL